MMDSATLAALKGSIKHWRENVEAADHKRVTMGIDYCPLCQMFNTEEKFCMGCPVRARVNRRYCLSTPYEGARHALETWAVVNDEPSKVRFRAAAQAELDFLISLLPEGETA